MFMRVDCLQEAEGWHVSLTKTSDGRYLAITALSKSSTEVHLLDAARPDSAPQCVHDRVPGARLAPCTCP